MDSAWLKKKLIHINQKALPIFMSLPKIMSYPRSGTHFLAASIYYNFQLSGNLSQFVKNQYAKWENQQNNYKVPWGKLFLTHEQYSPKFKKHKNRGNAD